MTVWISLSTPVKCVCECIQQLPSVWSGVANSNDGGKVCCTHYETNVAARHEGDTRVLSMSKSFGNAEEKRIYGLCTEFLFLNDNNHLGVLNGGDSPGSQDQFLPRLLQVDDVDAVGLLLEDVLLHRGLAVVGADVGGRSQHLGDVILLEIINRFSYNELS